MEVIDESTVLCAMVVTKFLGIQKGYLICFGFLSLGSRLSFWELTYSGDCDILCFIMEVYNGLTSQHGKNSDKRETLVHDKCKIV